ncbi:S41 family peptidase [Aristophania vespae]|uniref:S41 family peptidase n=1 Tax=Aristophania vespae TaxID=2697033 RepID=UPI0023519CA1|nr:S41 family peptidase [Aristophania vespae]
MGSIVLIGNFSLIFPAKAQANQFVFAQNSVQGDATQNDSTKPGSGTQALASHEINLLHNVLSSAFTFMLPRLLTPHSVQELSLWGLHSLIETDPDFSFVEITSDPVSEDSAPTAIHEEKTLHNLVFLKGNKLLVDQAFPSENDIEGWVNLILLVYQKSWNEGVAFQKLGKDAFLPMFFTEMFKHLDPYSRYLPSAKAKAERIHREGIHYSAGFTLEKTKGLYPVIASVNANSTAWEQGIDIGQKLLEVNGRKTANVALSEIQSWLTSSSESNISIKHTLASGKIEELELPLEPLPPETVFIDHKTSDYLVLRVKQFSTQTADEVSQYLSDALSTLPSHKSRRKKPPQLKGVILDLRGNKGGVLQQAVMTAALLLDHGVAATNIGRYPASNHVWAVQGGDITNNSPLVILVDDHTASAAEILAATLADHQRGVVIGSVTYGKGLIQTIGQLPNKGEIFITWSRNFGPLGEPIQDLGVMPQICLSASNGPSPSEQLAALKRGYSLQSSLIKEARSLRTGEDRQKIMKIRQRCPAVTDETIGLTTAFNLLASPRAYKAALQSVPNFVTAPQKKSDQL